MKAIRQSHIALALLLAFVVCACVSARTKALQASLTTVNVARDTLLAVDDKRESQIVDACNPPECTKEQGHTQLNAFRAMEMPVVTALNAAYSAIAAAALMSDSRSLADATSKGIAAIKIVEDFAAQWSKK